MALTLEQLQAQRDAILAQMSRPQEEHFGDRGMTRRTVTELEKALQRVDAEIVLVTAEAAGASRSRMTRVRTSKGI